MALNEKYSPTSKGSIMSSNEYLQNRIYPKWVARLVVGHCAERTVRRVINNNIDTEEMNLKDRITTRIGSMGIAGAASMAVGRYTDAFIDDVYDILYGEVVTGDKTNETIIIIDEVK
jgi:hypothetical protein